MTEIHTILNNFTGSAMLKSILPKEECYEFTHKKVFRLKDRIQCSCGHTMVYNGYDYARKKGFGKVRIGKQQCTHCGIEYQESKSFWKKLLNEWKETITTLILTLRDSNVAWEIISKVMDFLIPCGKDKARYLFNDRVEPFEYSQENCLIINYDEQHPKRGRTQNFRLTILNYETRVPIADELFDNKNSETIECFLRKHLNTEKEIVIITDCDNGYPAIFKKIWGNLVRHQKCLLHLNKLIVKDFGKFTNLQQEYNKYCMLNIFYNRKKELRFLEQRLKKQEKKNFSSQKQKREWVLKQKQKFYEYLRSLEKERRRNKKNLAQRTFPDAETQLKKLLATQAVFSKATKKRLVMIQKNWSTLTTFYSIDGCPATNNAIENYYSTSLKTHRKKQLRTDKGILNHLKLSAIKRAEGFSAPRRTLLEIYGLITLIT